jgi:hypothetical protein
VVYYEVPLGQREEVKRTYDNFAGSQVRAKK